MPAKVVARAAEPPVATERAKRTTTLRSSSSTAAPSSDAPASSSTTKTIRSTASRTTTTTRAVTTTTRTRAVPSSSSSSAPAKAAPSSASAKPPAPTTTATRLVRKTVTTTISASARTRVVPALAAAKEEPPLTQEDVLSKLKVLKECSPRLPLSILRILGVTAEELKLGDLGDLPSTSSVEKLSANRASYFAKQIVNVVLTSATELVNSGWKPSFKPAPANKVVAAKAASSRSASVASRTATSARGVPAAASRQASAATTTSRPTDASVRALINSFRVATRFLLQVFASGKGKELEVEMVALRFVHKIVSLDLLEMACEDVDFLTSSMLGQATSPSDNLERAILINPDEAWSEAQRTFLLELQYQAVACRLQTLQQGDLPAFASLLEGPEGPLAWQESERRRSNVNVKVVDRVAYATERSMSKCFQRLGSPTGLFSLPLRAVALRLLLRVSDLEVEAFWDRAARTGASCVKTVANEQGDVRAAFAEVEKVFQDLVGRAQSKAGEGYTRFCENWINLAKKAGRPESVDLAAEALTHEEVAADVTELVEAPPVPATANLTDTDLVRISANLAKAVVTLDQILKGSADSASAPETLQESAKAIRAVCAWPATASISSRVKLYRVLDQIRRRSLKALDSPKPASSRPCTPTLASDDQPSAAILKLLLAVVDLEQTAMEHLSFAKEEKQLPNQLEHLTDLVYTLRVLTNSRFEVSSGARQEECHRYLTQCSSFLDGPTIPLEARSESLFLISSSFYNIGGRLYSDRRYDAAARFIRPACELGAEAASTYVQWKEARMDDGDRTSKDEEAEKRSEGLAKKWEHLAVSYRLGSNKSKCLEAYEKAIFSAPLEKLEAQSDEVGVFQRKEWASLAGMLKSAIETSVFDLLQSQEESGVAAWMLRQEKYPKAAGAMLEHCVSVLEARAHHDEALAAIRSLMDVVKTIYSREGLSTRLGRVLMKRVEFELLSSSAVVEEVEALIQEAHGCFLKDAERPLKPFLPQYRASLLFLQVEVEQSRSSPSSCDEIVKHSKEACKELRGMLSTKIVSTSSPATARSSLSGKAKSVPPPAPSRALRTNPVPPQIKSIPVTPPSKSRKVKPINLVTPDSSKRAQRPSAAGTVVATSSFDNLDHLCAQLEQVYEALATYGHTHSSIEVVKILRRVSQSSLDKDIYLRASAALAEQYLQLGKNARASSVLNQALSFFQKTPGTAVSDDTRFRCLLVSAEYLCRTGSVEKGVKRFEEAVSLVQIDSPKKGSSIQQAMEKCRSIERRSMAWDVHSTIQCARGDLAGAVQSAMQAVRLGVRMTSLLSKLTASPSPKERRGKNDPALFSSDTDTSIQPEKRKLPKLSSTALAALYWRLSRHLIRSFLRVSQLYSVRGSGCDAEAFAGEGIELANALNLSMALTKALIQRGEIRLQLNQVAAGQEDLSRCLTLLQESWIPEAIVLTCIQGDSLAKIEQLPEALKAYIAGEATLQNLNTAFTELDAILPSPRPAPAARRSTPGGMTPGSQRTSMGLDALLPEVQGRLLRRQAWILQLLGRSEESEDLIEKAINVTDASVEAKVEHHLLQGRVALRRALQQLESDQLLSMLPDAAISIPMIPSSTSTKALPVISNSAVKSAMDLLAPADAAFTDALEKGGASSHALAVREAFISLAQVHTMQAMLGKGVKGAAGGAASLVDSALSVSIRRDLIHAVEQKLKEDTLVDPNAWPSFEEIEEDEDETEMLGKKMSKLGLDEPTNGEPKSVADYWKLVKGRHVVSQQATTKSTPDLLPQNWTVISLSFLKDRETLLLTRQTGGGGADGCCAKEPAIYSLPLNRQSRREGEESELSLRAAQEKLEEVVRSSNDGVHNAKGVEGMEARKRWWSARRALDKELEDLLAAMESTWLGAFKGVFAELSKDEQALASLRSRFDKIIRRSCFPGKKPPKLKLDDAVFECFSGLPLDCTDEDIEDLLHYVMDALQFGGLQVAVDEVDMDEVSMDLRNALDEYRGKLAGNGGFEGDSDHHIFLVLDKDVAMFPWESMPILRGRAVSRIPSMAFLQDRIDLAKVYHCQPGEQMGGSMLDSDAWRVALRNGKLFNLSKKRTFYLLNPSGDLSRSQERFEPWLKSRGWSGVVGRAPIMEELPKGLESNDLMLYFGHSGAEQYIRQAKIRELQRCAVTMLWGCSSAILRDHGDFDRTGTPLNYMCAGSPAMVGSLWDTTDRELDSVCEGVLTKLGLMKRSEGEGERGLVASRSAQEMSIVRAVAESRSECKLSFLTGASCVVYGVPVYWAQDEKVE